MGSSRGLLEGRGALGVGTVPVIWATEGRRRTGPKVGAGRWTWGGHGSWFSIRSVERLTREGVNGRNRESRPQGGLDDDGAKFGRRAC